MPHSGEAHALTAFPFEKSDREQVATGGNDVDAYSTGTVPLLFVAGVSCPAVLRIEASGKSLALDRDDEVEVTGPSPSHVEVAAERRRADETPVEP